MLAILTGVGAGIIKVRIAAHHNGVTRDSDTGSDSIHAIEPFSFQQRKVRSATFVGSLMKVGDAPPGSSCKSSGLQVVSLSRPGGFVTAARHGLPVSGVRP